MSQITCVQQPLHIAIVTETFPPEINGVAHTLNKLTLGLSQRGYRVSVIRPRQNDENSRTHQENINTQLTSGFNIPGYSGLQLGLPQFQRISKWWRHDPPDVVYISTEGPLGYAALWVARRKGIPVLSGFHTNFHQYTAHYKFGLLKNLVFRYLRHFHNRTHGTLVPDAGLANQLCKMGIQPVHVMTRGVDTDLFSPSKRNIQLRQQWGVLEHQRVLLCVGRIAPEKNLSLAIHSFRVAQEYYNGLRMVIVGDGPLLNTLSRENPDIIFTGEISDHLLAEHYASSDIFLFASETETFGNVTLEAMASGLAVVAFDYAAAKMHIQNQHNGVLVTPGKYNDFTSACVSLLKNQHHQKLGEQARQHSLNLGWHHIIDQFENLLLQKTRQIPATNIQSPATVGYENNRP